MLKKSLEYTLVGFEVPLPLSGCYGVGFKKQKKVYVSNPFLKNHTNRRNSIGCHLRSGDVTIKFVVAVVGVSVFTFVLSFFFLVAAEKKS